MAAGACLREATGDEEAMVHRAAGEDTDRQDEEDTARARVVGAVTAHRLGAMAAQ